MLHTKIYLLPVSMLAITIASGIIASSSHTLAEDISPVDDTINITVDSSCTMGIMSSSSLTGIIPGETKNIGFYNMAAYCNDNNGYDIYAIGYTNGEYGNTNMQSTTGNTIPTGTSGENSYWNMSLTPGTATGQTTHIPTIVSPFTNNTAIPSDYTKVATYPSTTIPQGTDPLVSGSYFEAVYYAHASTTQPAGTYTGQVQYVMVHPVGAPRPEVHSLYNAVKELAKKDASGNERTQTLADMQATITSPTTTDPTTDASNSGVYKYDASTFGTASDASNDYIIYYYRGVLEPEADQGTYGSDGRATTYPNYVKLGNNTCWRIVRTTGSGGVKMIYNGTWTGNTCANKQADTQLTTSLFNNSYSSIVYVGYTYNGNYTKVATTDGVSTDLVFGSNEYPARNNKRSIIKTYIEDTWYDSDMVNYTSKLEPAAGYCSDRSLYDDIYRPMSSVITSQVSLFGASVRHYVSGNKVTLACPRGDVDNYRYETNSAGISNVLKYPAALLTADETVLAGSGDGFAYSSNYNMKSFLCSGSEFWLLSPGIRDSTGNVGDSYMTPSGFLANHLVGVALGVRPTISLKHETTMKGGSGTATDPWIINE